jgi:3-oxoacyl-[acyl-carrier protein] reductase
MADRKIAIVTGSSRGIGAAVATRLARDVMAVAVNFAGREDPARALVDKISAAGGQAMIAKADVSDPAAVAAMFSAIEAKYGGIDVLVNNAGIMKLAMVAEADDKMFDQQCCMWRSSTTPSMCCIVFRKGRRKRAKPI